MFYLHPSSIQALIIHLDFALYPKLASSCLIDRAQFTLSYSSKLFNPVVNARDIFTPPTTFSKKKSENNSVFQRKKRSPPKT